MARRKKSRLERFFSLNQHRRRWGAGKSVTPEGTFAELKAQIVDGGEVVQTLGSSKSVEEHLQRLRSEFSGQSELIYEHARLIVLIRREYQVEVTFRRFSQLWQEEQAFLLENLNLRWLVSATDTFADLDPDPGNRALALSVSLLVNTIKMSESERYITDVSDPPVNPEKVAWLQGNLVPIFSGLSMFTVGTDDTLRNMRWRIDALADSHPLGVILQSVFQKLQSEDTVYSRMRRLHHRDRTGWW